MEHTACASYQIRPVCKAACMPAQTDAWPCGMCTYSTMGNPVSPSSSVNISVSVMVSTYYCVGARVHNQECATACTTSMLCCDGRTSHHVTWFKRLCWQTVQSDHKRVVPKAGLRTTQYLSCTRVHGFIT